MVTKASSGHAHVQHPLALNEADDGIAALDVMVKEVERLAGECRPQARAQPCRVRQQEDCLRVNTIDTLADDIADGGTKGGRRGPFFSGTDYSQFRSDASGCGKEGYDRNRRRYQQHAGRAKPVRG